MCLSSLFNEYDCFKEEGKQAIEIMLRSYEIDVSSDVALSAKDRFLHLTREQWVELRGRAERGFLDSGRQLVAG